MRLFTFNSIDLSSVPPVLLTFSEGFTPEEETALREFEQEYKKHINIMEIHNYETSELLMSAFEEFLEEKGMVDSDEEDNVTVLAMITSVTHIVIGTKATLLIELTKTSEDDVDFESEDSDEDDFEA